MRSLWAVSYQYIELPSSVREDCEGPCEPRRSGGQLERGPTGLRGWGLAGVAIMPKVMLRVRLIASPAPCVA